MNDIIANLVTNEVSKPLDLDGHNVDYLHKSYKCMQLIRKVEDKVAQMYRDKQVRCPVHLGAGQEAIAVGVCDNLKSSDYVFGTHRAHAHYFAMGGDLHKFFAEVLGKNTGCAKGLGGSMHLLDKENGFWGSVPIVGATIPLATGAALAAKRLSNNAVAVCFFGDGAAEEGVLHESLNLAASVNLPVLFVCENNFYSSHLDIKYRQPSQRVARFADAHCIKAESVDGNNVLAVRESSASMIDYIRATGKPGFLEFVTYRLYGHVGPNKDIDVGVRRSMDDIQFWQDNDPIKRLARAMVKSGFAQDKLNDIANKIDADIESAVSQALADPYPDASELLDNVYAGPGGNK